jgi:hypothetical protein
MVDKKARMMIYMIYKYICGGGMDKIIRNINEQLWREVKSRAALDGLSMKDWVERVLAEKLRREELLEEKRDRRRKI